MIFAFDAYLVLKYVGIIFLCRLTNLLHSSKRPRDIQLSAPDQKVLHLYQFSDFFLCDNYKKRRSVQNRLSFVINRIVDV